MTIQFPSRTALLNDDFRNRGESSRVPGRIATSAAVRALPDRKLVQLMGQVRCVDYRQSDIDISPDHQEGCVVLDGQTYRWSFKYFSNEFCDGPSGDPGDPNDSFRILTIKHDSEN